jgi:hypothetical protein
VQIKQGKAPILPVELLNNFSVIFQVSVPFTYGPAVQPISLTSSETAAGSFCAVSGWGYLSPIVQPSRQLYAVEVGITSLALCDTDYAVNGGITKNTICAALPGGGKSLCNDD